ncbi:MAG: peptide antibiotic transporter SbmA [Pseudomonadota bacterium]
MFRSFFPRPQLFFLSATVWGLIGIVAWFLLVSPAVNPGEGDEPPTSLIFGLTAPTLWLYGYVTACFVVFGAVWTRIEPHRWAVWSVWGTVLILFMTWFQVQLDVMLNYWFRSFFDVIQKALTEPGAVTASEYYGQIAVFLLIVMPLIFVAVVKDFVASHYVFRWRTAMNDRYVALWEQVRHIEGASQRIQDDTMRFARIMETLGVRFIDSVMTLVAFLPILWGLSSYVQELPIIGEIPQALFWVAIIWSVFGTGLLALAGIKLPGLEFRNQRVEAAYRKELVLGEDDEDRASPPVLAELFADVRTNYFRLFRNYLYFNIVRYGYLQFGVMVPYIALGPTVIAAGFTYGVMQQILQAFSRVENSFQFLVNSWTTIVELMSIYKRLRAFEAAIAGDEQAAIEFEAPGMNEPLRPEGT